MMKALTGLIALVVILIGVAMLTKAPGLTRLPHPMELTEDQHDRGPPFAHVYPDGWR
jgi:hypothetical protein